MKMSDLPEGFPQPQELTGTVDYKVPPKGWMDTPVEYLCDVAHVQATHLGLLVHGEKAWEVKNWKEKIKRFSEN